MVILIVVPPRYVNSHIDAINMTSWHLLTGGVFMTGRDTIITCCLWVGQTAAAISIRRTRWAGRVAAGLTASCIEKPVGWTNSRHDENCCAEETAGCSGGHESWIRGTWYVCYDWTTSKLSFKTDHSWIKSRVWTRRRMVRRIPGMYMMTTRHKHTDRQNPQYDGGRLPTGWVAWESFNSFRTEKNIGH